MCDYLTTSLWCVAMQKTVRVRGKITGHRQAHIFKIQECEHHKCEKQNKKGCLIGKEVEGSF